MRHLALAFFVASSALTFGATLEASVPAQFQGHWASSIAKCTSAHEGSLDIGKNRVDFYEGSGRVVSVRRISTSEVEIELESIGEKETWKDTRRFVLSSDWRTLTDATSSKSEYHTKRVRCRKIS
jgi:hypothetical protein